MTSSLYGMEDQEDASLDTIDAALPWVENRSNETNGFVILNTNARSLAPKMNSFVDCFNETDCKLAIITETWFGSSSDHAQDMDDVHLSTGIAWITRNRPPVASGVCYGGLAIAFRSSAVTLKEYSCPNPDAHEVLVAVGNVAGQSRKLIVIAAYLPPGDAVPRGRAGLQFIGDMVMEVKRKYSEPLIVVAGDFNQWDIKTALDDYIDIKEVNVGNTRGSRAIDRIFLNFHDALVDKGTLPPLQTEIIPGEPIRESDHLTVFAKTRLEKLRTFEWLSYNYLYYNEDSVEEFKAWVVGHDWGEVLNAQSSNAKASNYQAVVTKALEQIFPTKTTRRKSTDLPWINGGIRKKIERRMSIFKDKGRSVRWRRQEVITHRMIKERRGRYFANQKIYILTKDASRVFFKNVRRYKSADKPPEFDVRSLRPGIGDAALAEELSRVF